MKRWFKDILLLGLVGVLAVIFLIMPGETAANGKEEVVMGNINSVLNLDPSSSTTMGPITLNRSLYQGLLRYKFNSGELEGDMAQSWSLSKDGLVYTFKLRDNLKWHKGFGKVTAHDVKFSIDRIMDPKTRSPHLGDLKMIKEVKVIDDLTVEVHLKERDVTFPHRFARPKPVSIVSQNAVEKYGKDFARNPIGSGPFVFESMSREEVVLVANKEYYEGPPKIKKVIYKTIPDVDTMVMSLIKGEVDLIPDLPAQQTIFDRIKTEGCKIAMMINGHHYMLLINHKVEPLGDLRVRRAIAYGIDKDEIVSHAFAPGALDRLDSLVPKGCFGHTEEGLPRYNFDPLKAKALLAEAGYANGFEITLDTRTSFDYLTICTIIQSQLAKVGIKLKLAVMDSPTWLKKISEGNSSLALFQPQRIWDADAPLTSFFHSGGFPPGYNLARYNKLDREIDKARQELDKTKRLKMYHEIQQKLMEDLPAIPLFNFKFSVGCRPNIGGLPDRDPIQGIDFYHLYFEK